MLDPSLIQNLGVPGLALWILWMSYKGFMARLKEKDAEQMKEREEFSKRMDKKDEQARVLNEDIRNNLATVLTENSNILKQAIILLTKRARKRDKTHS